MKKLLQIELNEFSLELLKGYAYKYNFQNIITLINLDHKTIYTNELTEHRDLDPWVQWVSVHTGVPLSEHGIKYLGDANDNLNTLQTWDILAASNITSGLWCLMNVRYFRNKNICFYLPDPWSAKRDIKPRSLELMINLPLYYSRNYLNLKFSKTIVAAFKSAYFFYKKGLVGDVLKNLLLILHGIKYIREYSIVFFAIFDLLSVIAFSKYRKKYNPDYSIIFINCIAHMQHHKWISNPKKNINFFVFKVLDKILEILIKDTSSNDGIILTNGFTQQYENEDYFVYRQKDPHKYLKTIGIQYESLTQGMTNDCLIKFIDSRSLYKAKQILESALIEEDKIFYVDVYNLKELILFYRLDYKKKVTKSTMYYIEKDKYIFFDHFKLITNRTGSHWPLGDIFCKNIIIPNIVRNDHLNNFILNFFGIKTI